MKAYPFIARIGTMEPDPTCDCCDHEDEPCRYCDCCDEGCGGCRFKALADDATDGPVEVRIRFTGTRAEQEELCRRFGAFMGKKLGPLLSAVDSRSLDRDDQFDEPEAKP